MKFVKISMDMKQDEALTDFSPYLVVYEEDIIRPDFSTYSSQVYEDKYGKSQLNSTKRSNG
jgi:hypothetical protein